jgi:hypothetical protein
MKLKILLDDTEDVGFFTYSIDEIPTLTVVREADDFVIQIEKDLKNKVKVEEIITDVRLQRYWIEKGLNL